MTILDHLRAENRQRQIPKKESASTDDFHPLYLDRLWGRLQEVSRWSQNLREQLVATKTIPHGVSIKDIQSDLDRLDQVTAGLAFYLLEAGSHTEQAEHNVDDSTFRAFALLIEAHCDEVMVFMRTLDNDEVPKPITINHAKTVANKRPSA